MAEVAWRAEFLHPNAAWRDAGLWELAAVLERSFGAPVWAAGNAEVAPPEARQAFEELRHATRSP
eukprot:6242067-Alexandrium_andersonii.AAC.1